MRSRNFSWAYVFSARLEKSSKIFKKNFKTATKNNVRLFRRRTKRESPVLTGLLRSRIQGQVIDSFTGVVYTDVRYAGFVHEGTSRNRANRFMTRAYSSTQSQILSNYDVAMQRSLREFIR